MDHSPVPVNLITGLLGAGKTSMLRHLLARVPAGERWAVVVNEFGELGIDGAALAQAGEQAAEGGDERGRGRAAIREVPGGCLCCSAQTGLRVALTQLLREERPRRVLIEPSGVGHPAGVIDVLREPTLAAAIRVQAVVAVVDPRQYTPQRLAAAQAFVDQLNLADVLVLNKTDLASAQERAALLGAARALYPPKLAVVETTHGRIDPGLLDLPGGWPLPERTARSADAPEHRHAPRHNPHHPVRHDAVTESVPGLGTRVSRREVGYQVAGWYAGPEAVFQRRRLQALFAELAGPTRYGLPPVARAKGVLRTGRDWQLLNWAGDALEIRPLAWRRDNRLELILDLPEDAPGPVWSGFEAALRDCLAPAPP